MADKQRRRWENVDHSDEPLIDHVMTRGTTHTRGPIPEFIAQKKAEQAWKTYQQHRDTLTQLATFMESQGLTTVGDLTVHAVNLFRIHLKERGLSEGTVANRLRSIRAFGNWMADRGWTEGNPLKGLKVPKSPRPHFDLIPDQVRAQLFALYNPETFLGARNLAILAVLSDTGLRREEVAGLQFKHLDLTGSVVRVFSDKTTEWRYVPLTDETVAYLRNYLKWRQRYFAQPGTRRVVSGATTRVRYHREANPDQVFVAWNGHPLEPQMLGKIVGRAGGKLGYHLHPHLFRHDWITRKALDGENPSIVKRWAGHKAFAMTDYYFELAEELLGAIKPKRSVLSGLPVPGKRGRGRGRPPTSAAT